MNNRCSEFTQFLLNEQPHYNAEILKQIRPDSGGWVSFLTDPSYHHWRGSGIIQFFSPYDFDPRDHAFKSKLSKIYPDTFQPWK